MPSASFGGGAVRVRAPRGYDASAASDRADRDLPGGGAGAAQRAALVEALRAGDFVVVDRIDLTPQRGRDLDGRAPANRRGTVTLDVDVPAGRRRGRPARARRPLLVAPARRRRRAHPVDRPRTAHRVLRARRSSPSAPAVHHRAPARSAPPAAGADRGLLGDLAHGALQAIVLRFAAPVVVGKVVEHLESGVRTGLVHVTGGTLDAWKPVGHARGGRPPHRPARPRPAARPRHVLLDDRGLRGARRHARGRGLRRHPRVRVRRRHRLRPPHPQRRPRAQRA